MPRIDEVKTGVPAKIKASSPTVRLILEDYLTALPTLEAGSIDAVVCDPPYGIGGAVVRSSGRSVIGMPDWDVLEFQWLPLVVPLLKPDASVVAFTDTRSPGVLWEAMHSVGLRPKQMVYWVKHAPPPNPRQCFQSAVEVAVWATFGKGIWNGGALTPNVVWYEGPHKGRRSHPAEKPLALMRWLVELFCPFGGTCLDPCMGSGTTGVACVQAGRNFIGIERVPEYHIVSENRLDEVLSVGKPVELEGLPYFISALVEANSA